MTLQEALDWLMADKAPWNELQLRSISRHDRTTIATILNAVVNGELK